MGEGELWLEHSESVFDASANCGNSGLVKSMSEGELWLERSESVFDASANCGNSG